MQVVLFRLVQWQCIHHHLFLCSFQKYAGSIWHLIILFSFLHLLNCLHVYLQNSSEKIAGFDVDMSSDEWLLFTVSHSNRTIYKTTLLNNFTKKGKIVKRSTPQTEQVRNLYINTLQTKFWGDCQKVNTSVWTGKRSLYIPCKLSFWGI